WPAVLRAERLAWCEDASLGTRKKDVSIVPLRLSLDEGTHALEPGILLRGVGVLKVRLATLECAGDPHVSRIVCRLIDEERNRPGPLVICVREQCLELFYGDTFLQPRASYRSEHRLHLQHVRPPWSRDGQYGLSRRRSTRGDRPRRPPPTVGQDSGAAFILCGNGTEE